MCDHRDKPQFFSCCRRIQRQLVPRYRFLQQPNLETRTLLLTGSFEALLSFKFVNECLRGLVEASGIKALLRFTLGRCKHRSFIRSVLARCTFFQNVRNPPFQPADQVFGGNANAASLFHDGTDGGLGDRVPLRRSEDSASSRNGEQFANIGRGFRIVPLDERPDPSISGELNPYYGSGLGSFRCRYRFPGGDPTDISPTLNVPAT